MASSAIDLLITQLLAGDLSREQFTQAVLDSTVAPGEAVTLDLDRQRRCGFPEVIYSEGKPVETMLAIFRELQNQGSRILATRASAEQASAISAEFPAVVYNAVARTLRLDPDDGAPEVDTDFGTVGVITAGTTDLPVAEEARETLGWMQTPVYQVHDAGVAGPQRLLMHVPRLRTCAAVVVAAGMEGALPSIVGGHLPCPVVAVPTSVGYGAGAGGIAALLGMLNSCASNVTVVNIDAGFKAGYVAGMIARQSKPREA